MGDWMVIRVIFKEKGIFNTKEKGEMYEKKQR